MRRFITGIVTVAAFWVSACAVLSNPDAPERASATPPPGSGIVVISAGAAARCFEAATLLFIAPVGSPYFEDIRGERTGIARGNPACKFDGRVGGERRLERGRRLVEKLMREDAAAFVFAGFGEEIVHIAVEIGGGFIDDEEGRTALMLRDDSAL